jgi:hypothetical protein
MPLDFGMKLGGRRVFGDSRDFEGVFLAFVIGVCGVVATSSYLPFFAALGANFGTLCESFIKRRLGYRCGQHMWVIDETDIMLGATVFLLPIIQIRADVFVFAFLATFTGHYLFNILLRPGIERRVA